MPGPADGLGMLLLTRSRCLRLVTGGLVLGGLVLTPLPAFAGKGPRPTASPSTSPTGSDGWTYVRASNPARTLVKDGSGALLATLTDGSRSVVLAGPARTFAESTTKATVTTGSWVRLLPSAHDGRVDPLWLTASLADRGPDVLAVAAQYITGAGTVLASDGTVLSADASYGPLVDGARQEGSDWNDFLQVTASYDGTTDAPEPLQRGALDCSGFVRMVFGQRLGLPMVLAPDGVRLPRRATQMATKAPGTVVATSATRLNDLSRLLPGDLVLFDASTDDGTAVDHVGIYLGQDSAGHPRFVSSRKTADGPTLGDVGGRSTLDGTGLYATSLRQVRRL